MTCIRAEQYLTSTVFSHCLPVERKFESPDIAAPAFFFLVRVPFVTTEKSLSHPITLAKHVSNAEK